MVLGKQREAQRNSGSRWSPGVIRGAELMKILCSWQVRHYHEH